MKYSKKEMDYIKKEIQALFISRNQPIPVEQVKQWLNDFDEENYSAEIVCRLLRLARFKVTKSLITFADLMSLEEEAYQFNDQIIPTPLLKNKQNQDTEEDEDPELLELIREYKQQGSKIIDYILSPEQEQGISFKEFLKIKLNKK